MAEWLYEDGIGERRAALVADGRIVEARIERDGEGPRVGAIVAARLVEAGHGDKSAPIALDVPGAPQAMLHDLPSGTAVGAALRVEIVRMGLRERGRDKMARARMAAADAALQDGPDLHARIAATGLPVIAGRAHGGDALEAAGWSELLDAARTGRWPFPGGELWIDVTPAMTLIDIDGAGDGFALARAGAVAAAAAIRCFAIGGSIGIDFPSLKNRDERLAVAAIFDDDMPAPFERTAVNGFGFLQVIRRRERPSLIEQLQFDGVASDAAALLRRAERAVGTGTLALRCRPVVADFIAANLDWVALLQGRTGRAVELVADTASTGAGHAQ